MNEHERRRLFFTAMRRPEMRVLRAALWDLKWERNIDWHTFTEMEITIPQPPYTDGWWLKTDHHVSFCFWPNDVHPWFSVYRLHDANDSACPCEYCVVERAHAQT